MLVKCNTIFRRLLISAGFLVLLFVKGISQFVGRPFVINYDKREYLADNQNWSVADDGNGIVYIGNNAGLLEFDGSNWKLHKMPGNGIVRSVTVGEDGLIYVGSYEEFGYWKRSETGTLDYTSLSRDLLSDRRFHNDEIWRIIQQDGNYYFQSFSTIFVYNGRTIKFIKPPTSFVLMMKARERLFIHVVNRGLYEVRQDSLFFMEGTEALANDEIKVVLPYRHDQYLVGAQGSGIFRYDGKKLASWDNPLNLEIKLANLNNGIAGFGRIAIGTVGNGIYLFDSDGTLLQHIDTRNSLQNNTVLGMAFDRDGNVWAALDRGIDLINLNSGMDFYIDPTGAKGAAYTAILDRDDLLVGTNQGLYRYGFEPGTGFTDPEFIDGLQGQVWDLKNFDGITYCGHNSGTYRVEKGSVKKISGINGGFEMKEYRKGSRDLVLQSTYSALSLYTKNQDGLTFLNSMDGLFEPIRNFETDFMGNIWAVHAIAGILRIKPGADLLSVDKVYRIDAAPGGRAGLMQDVSLVEGRLVFTGQSGVLAVDDLNDTIVPYGQLNDKLGEFSTSQHIFKARDHHYWFVRDHEIALFRITEEAVRLLFRYDLSMQGLYLNTRFPKIINLRDHLHLICLDNGFAVIDESVLMNSSRPSKVRIRDFTASNKAGNHTSLPVGPGLKPQKVTYPYRNVMINYSSNNGYQFPQYQYRLEGLEKEWRSWTGSATAEFIRLPQGDYVFQVVAKDIGGRLSDTAEYPFMIMAPWYNSFIAWIIYGILIIGTGLGLRYTFLRRLHLHRMKIESEESEKRKQEALLAEQEMIRLKNEKLQSEIDFKNTQLADYTMSMIRKNENLIRIREEIQRNLKEAGTGNPRAVFEKIIRITDRQISSEEDWNTFETHFDQAHQDYIRRLKLEYPDLTQSDLKLCAFLRLNISSKGIARLLNISIRGVEVRRYRLRKRLNLDSGQNLYDFLLNF